jgi:hypothetical protein
MISSDYQMNSDSSAEPRPMRNGRLGGSPSLSTSGDPNYTHSNPDHTPDLFIDHTPDLFIDHTPDLFIDEPPPYEMASNKSDQVGIPLQDMPAQHAEGQRIFQLLEQVVNEPVRERRFWHFWKLFQPAPVFQFSFSFPYALLIAVLFGVCFWVYWTRSGTP